MIMSSRSARMTRSSSLAVTVLLVASCMASVVAVSGATLLHDLSESILGSNGNNNKMHASADADGEGGHAEGSSSNPDAGGAAGGGGGGGGECQLALRVLAYDRDIALGETAHEAGFSTFRYPIYDPEGVANDEPPLGVYIGASTTVGNSANDGGGFEGDLGDCIGTGSFNFDYSDETESYESQIYVSVSCSGTFNAITGGTGRYAYIRNGHEVIADSHDIPGGSVSELHFTDRTCGDGAAAAAAAGQQQQ
jgi:hypothetical protein